jgi:methylated-DNA-[protein]-cysteine S-methyltransferase
MPHTLFSTSLGVCGIAWNDTGLTGFQLPGAGETATEKSLATRADATVRAEPPARIASLIARVRRHLAGEPQDFAGERFDFSVVTPFQRRVYEAALTVKSGRTGSYGALARQLGLPPGASRAIGHALGRNPWPLLVPCHRFLSATGKLTGFSAPGGVKTKARLLALEGAELLAE